MLRRKFSIFSAHYHPATCPRCSLAEDGGLGRARGLHELRHDVDGDREDDGGVVLRGDAVQGLEISQLGSRRLQMSHKWPF